MLLSKLNFTSILIFTIFCGILWVSVIFINGIKTLSYKQTTQPKEKLTFADLSFFPKSTIFERKKEEKKIEKRKEEILSQKESEEKALEEIVIITEGMPEVEKHKQEILREPDKKIADLIRGGWLTSD